MSKNMLTTMPALSVNIKPAEGDDGAGRNSKGAKDRHPRSRVGKTARDKANRAHATNQQNKEARAMWQQDTKATIANFPYANCNGKRNRSRIERTRKGNILIQYK